MYTKKDSQTSFNNQSATEEFELLQQLKGVKSQTVIINDSDASEPYQHLKSKKVFIQEAIKYQIQVRNLDNIEDINEKIIKLIDLNKKFVSALDKKRGVAETMTLDFFIDNYNKDLEIILDKME